MLARLGNALHTYDNLQTGLTADSANFQSRVSYHIAGGKTFPQANCDAKFAGKFDVGFFSITLTESDESNEFRNGP